MALFRRRGGDDDADGQTTIFFATDLHGSEVCFRKFVAAAGFYGADLLILGGDITGKLVVPIVERPDGRFRAERHGEEQILDAGDLERFERQMADEGSYTVRMTEAEHRGHAGDEAAIDALFNRLVCDRLRAWIDLAHERLEGSSVRIVTAPGNDDPYEVDDVIRERGGDRVLLMEGEVLEVAPGHEMISFGPSNRTPWHTHRELDEDEIARRIAAMADRLREPHAAIFNIHVPPYDSRIDEAPQLDENLMVRTSLGAPIIGPVGSTAVRAAIERYEPLVSLHGHVHESGGSAHIGRTVAINAGSEYGEGLLRGVLLTVGGGRLVRYQATSG